jgi:hypothetical protein
VNAESDVWDYEGCRAGQTAVQLRYNLLVGLGTDVGPTMTRLFSKAASDSRVSVFELSDRIMCNHIRRTIRWRLL